jgi:rhodanese-related sulfurtransferase
VSYWSPPPNVPEVTVEELAQARARGALVIDVREPDEYEAVHIPGAVLIPLGQVTARVGEISGEGPVYVICGTGSRSARAVEWYRTQGIDALNVAGGTKAWVEGGHPTQSGPVAG